MESSVNQVKEALSARSRTATLDELQQQGRKRVRLIRAEHVAAMIADAVHSAIEASGLIPQEEVDRLVARSREEFKDILHEREQEVRRAREVADKLDEVTEALGHAGRRIAELEAAGPAAAPAAVPAGQPGAEMVMMMMQELATLKAQVAQQQGAPQAPGQPAAAPQGQAADQSADLTTALDKLTGTLNERLDKFGRKIGISSAVDAGEVKFDNLFSDDDLSGMESNIDDVNVKQKSGGGIASNLARLKKLKGGG